MARVKTFGVTFVLVLALLSAVSVTSYLSSQRLLAANRDVVRSHQIMEKLELVLSVLKDAETGERGFVLTGEERYLEPFNDAGGRLPRELDSLQNLVSNDAAQRADLHRVRDLADAKLAVLRETIALRRQSGLDAALAVIRTDRGKQIMDEIRGVVAEMETRDREQLAARNAAAAIATKRTLFTTAVVTPVALLILAVFAIVVMRRTRFGGPGAQPARPGRNWGTIAWQYLFAAAAAAIGVGLRLWLVRYFGPLPAFVTVYPAVLLVATVAGGGPGIAATVLAAVATDYWVFEPVGTFRISAPNDVLALATFIATNICLCLVIERLRRALWAEATDVAHVQEEQRWATTLASIGDAVIATDAQGAISFINPVAESLTGLRLHEAQGRPVQEIFRIINEQTRQPADDIVARVLRQGSVVLLANHTALVTADDREIPIEDSAAPIKDGDGKIAGVVLVFHDVTQKRRAQEALRASEERLRVTLTSIGDAVLAADADGRVVFLNPVAAALTGWSPEEAAGKPIGELFRVINEQTRQPAEDIVARVLREGQIVQLANHTALLARDGREIPIEDSAAPIRDADGSLIGVVVVFHDVAEKRRAQEALRDAEFRYRTVAEHTFDFEFWLDPQGKFLYVSPACESVYGRKPAEFFADPELWFRTIHPDDLPAFQRHQAEETHRQRPGDVEFRIVRPDGSERWIAHVCQPVFGENGEYLGARGSNRDITERKRAEEEVKRAVELRQLALDAAHLGWWRYDPLTRMAYWDDVYKEIFGVRGYERLNDEILANIIHPEDLAPLWAKVEAALDPHDPRPYAAEYRIRRPDGAVRWIEAHGVASFAGEGAGRRATSFVGTVQDITDSKLAADALRASEERFRLALTPAPVIVSTLDRELRYTWTYNQQTRRTDEVIGKTDFDLFPNEADELTAAKRLVLAGETVRQNLWLTSAGQRIYLDLYMEPLRDAAGAVAGIGIAAVNRTELKLAEEETQRLMAAVQAEKERLSALVNSIGDEVWFADSHKQFTLANPAAVREFGAGVAGGIDVEKFAASLEVLRPDGTPRPVEETPPLRALAGEIIRGQEEIVRTPATGELRHREVNAAPVRDGAGNIIGSVSIVRDITERKRAAEQIEDLSRFPEENPQPVCRLADDGRILYCNDASQEMLRHWGVPAAGRQVPEALRRMVAETLAAGQPMAHEIDLPGRSYSVLLAPVPERGYVNLYARDITDQKRAEAERETAAEFLRLINASKSTSELIRAATEFFRQKSGCEAVGIRLRREHDYPYYETKGFPPEHVLLENNLCSCDENGQPILDSLGDPVLECMCGNVICGRFDPAQPFFTANGDFWSNNTSRLLATTTDADRQARTRNRCNGEGYESVALLGLRAGGRTLGLLQLNDKQTGRFSPEIIALWERLADYLAVALSKFAAEDELRDVNVSLEQRVRERTAELQRRATQLRALAAELGQAEDRERKRLATLLHDHLQQLLVAAKFSASSLRHRLTAPDLNAEAARVLDLLGQSIDASRSLTAELSPPILHDRGLGAGLLWLARWMHEKHGLTVEVAAPDEPFDLPDDLRLMAFQAVRELLFNVAKHAGVTSARVTMTHDDGRNLTVVVADQGKGFDAAALAAGNTPGSFGLFNIRERLASIDGGLEIESAPGAGTRIVLTAPIAPLPAPPLSPAVSAATAHEPAPAAAGAIRVLVADDHTVVRKGLVELLRKEPSLAVVGEAADGRQALDLARLLNPDVVLMDVSMPVMSGIDATRVLLAEMPSVRVIGLSMHAQADMAAQMRAAGAVRYLVKDGPMEDLLKAIRDAAQ